MTNRHLIFHQNVQMSRSFVAKLNEQIAEYNLYHSQWVIIYFLKNFGESTLVNIANYLKLEKSSVTRAVCRLEKHNLVKAVQGKDKREKIIQLTDLGESIYTSCRQIIDEFEEKILNGISEKEQRVFFQILCKITKNILAVEDGSNHE